MADDDCSNCEIDNCKFRDYNDGCHFIYLKDVKDNLNDNDITILESAFNLLEKINNENKANTYIFRSAAEELKDILQFYKDSKAIDSD